MNGMFGGGMWFGWLFWILLIVVIVWAIIQFTNRNQQTNLNSIDETPLDILKKRYAKGEISKKEFYEIRKGL